MDTIRLKYFCAIAEIGSLTKAAEILNISHSGLSKAMSVLQEELGEQIFRPQGRGLELTERGKDLYTKCKEILDLVAKLKEADSLSKKKFLRIGLAEIFAISIAGDIAQSISPDLSQSIDFYDLDSGEAEVQILSGKIDFALSFVPFPHRDIEYLKIKRTPMGIYFNNPHFAKLELEQLPFVTPNIEIENNPLSIKSRDGWPTELRRKVQFGANTLALALQMVDAGNAAIFIPQFVAKNLNRRRSFQFQEYEVKKVFLAESTRDIYLVKKKNLEESQEMKLLAKVVRKLC